MAKAPKARSAKTRSTTSKGARCQGDALENDKNQSGENKRLGTDESYGVTVPKTLTNALDSLVNSERGREILASALVAAASAAAAALVKRSDSPQVAKAREAANEAGDQMASATKDQTTRSHQQSPPPIPRVLQFPR